MYLRDLVQVEISGDDLCLKLFCQLNQLQVHFPCLREIVLHDLHIQQRVALHPLEHIEPAPSALPLRAVGGIGHHLQLMQNKFRDDQCPIHKSGFGHVSNTTINNRACVQQLHVPSRLPVAGKQSAQRGEVQQVPFARTHHKAHVGHEQQHKNLQDTAHTSGGKAIGQHQAEQKGAEDAENTSGHSANQPAQPQRAHTYFKEDHQGGSRRSHTRRHSCGQSKRPKEVTGSSKYKNKNNAYKNEVHTDPPNI